MSVRHHRQLVSPVAERRELRRELIACYRNDPRFDAIVQQDIRPLWTELNQGCDVQALIVEHISAVGDGCQRLMQWPSPKKQAQIASGGTVYPYFAYLEAVQDRCSELSEYVDAVFERGVRPLGLLQHGRPAHWPASFVHASASSVPYPVNPEYWTHPFTYDNDPDTDPDDPPIADEHVARFWLEIAVSPDLGAATLSRPDRAWDGSGPFSNWQPDAVVDNGPISDPSLAFLELQALDAVRAWFAEARQGYRDRFPHKNPTTSRRQLADLRAFHRLLFYRNWIPDVAERKRVRRLADTIGVDWPRHR
ncbi:MAG TPA: hypothetical protein VFI42_09725 [Thermomicrobiaceae bacterium]|nr:hypothetical protein [Thermomicrobiaceae bacterium]